MNIGAMTVGWGLSIRKMALTLPVKITFLQQLPPKYFQGLLLFQVHNRMPIFFFFITFILFLSGQ